MEATTGEPSLNRSISYQRTLSSPTTTPLQLQNHLYLGFLSGDTADISVRVFGSWNATYKLHRIVLTQAGFFRSLFSGGFSEASSNVNVVQGQVQLRFDHDPNITRAAFEICLARLYGGGPSLHVCPTIQPTSSEPLTTAYTQTWVEPAPVPKDHHPASPRFLLSLLSTAFYLSIPNLASEALNMILSTIGPTTVIRYLDYALGKGIGPMNLTDPERAVTLEHIGQDVDSASVYTTNTEATFESSQVEGRDDDSGSRFGGTATVEIKPEVSQSFLYGAVSNKVGEACAAFLTRWGIDLLAQEEQQSHTDVISPTPLASYPLLPLASTSSVSWRPTTPSLRIWSQGLSAEWVCGVLSSDELYVKSEIQRYETSKQIVDMRRRQKGVIQEEELEWDRLFQEGIYYSHFSWEELLHISEERSPVTGTPYVPLSHLQAAHWSFAKMQQMIMKPSSSLDSNPRQGLKLGFEVESTDIASRASPGQEAYWPVPIDTSLRIGDPGSAAPTEDLFAPPAPRIQLSRRPVTAQNYFGIGNPRRSRGSLSSEREESSPNSTKADKWVAYEPFRFSVEFWGVESLKEKTRLYSHTIFYAGSCYNVYTQAVRKKGLQLGVYLHRQSNVDPIPAASAPRASQTQPSPSVWPTSLPGSDAIANNNSSVTLIHGSRTHIRSTPSNEPVSPRGTTPGRSPIFRSSTPVAIPRSPRYIHSNASFSPSSPTSPLSSPGSHPASGLPGTATGRHSSVAPAPPHQPYRDPRPAVSAYFSIACHSSTGSSLTRFSSAPDTFAVSQSWGWKSSSLDVGEVTDEQNAQEQSLRATIVMGLV